jgi:hypothetical protein
MSNDLEQRLRAAFDHLAGPLAPPGLVSGTLRKARQHRRRQLVTAGVAIAAVAAGTYAGAAALTGRTSTVDAAAGGDIAVTGLSCQPGAAYQPDEPPHSRLLNPATGRYVTVPYCGAVPSPDLTKAVVTGGAGSKADPEKQGILDIATGQVRWISGVAGLAVWSPDSRQVLLYTNQAAQILHTGRGYALVDAATAVARLVPFQNPRGAPVWLPDGTIAIVTCGCPTAPAPRGEVVDPGYYADPTPGPRVPVTLPPGKRPDHPIRVTTPGVPDPAPVEEVHTGRNWRPLPMVSPDGTRVVFTVAEGMDAPVVDVAATSTGRQLHRITLPAYNEVVGWYDADHLITHYLPRHPAPGAKDTDEVLSIISVSTGKVERTVRRDTGYGTIEFDADVTVGGVSGKATKVGF